MKRGPLEPAGPELLARRYTSHVLLFAGHALVYALGYALLRVTAGELVALIVALGWGIALALHGFFAVLAPLLRGPLEKHALRRLEPATPAAAPENGRSLEALSAAIAHELRNPLTAAMSLVQQLAEDPTAPEAPEYAAVALAELARVERSIVHLLRFARDESLELAPCNLAAVAHSALDTQRERAAALGVTLSASLEDGGPLRGDEEKLRRVLINLLVNALDALQEAATAAPRVELASGANLAGTELWVSVRDNGPGFTEASLARLFTPYFTTKKSGTGFGLALSRKTVEAHGGTLEARNRKGGGAEFVLVVPREPRARHEGPQ